jgi:hypothetical protein
MTNAPSAPAAPDPILPDMTLWEHQYAIHWGDQTYRIRQIRPRVFVLSRLAKDGKFDYIAAGPSPEGAIQNAIPLLRVSGSSGPRPPAGSGSAIGSGR